MAQWQWLDRCSYQCFISHCKPSKRTRRAYQITAAALHLLQHQGHAKYTTKAADDEEVITIEEWTSQMSKKSPQFLYWVRVLDLELCCQQLVRALREAHFALYVQTQTQIVL